MEPIFLPQLAHAPQQTEILAVNTPLADLDALTPVQGQLKVVHQGNYLQVEGKAETIVTLTCDRCLQQYNHRLQIEVAEFIWLRETTAADALADGVLVLTETDELVETLPPDGYFQPDDWLYQQLCLALPQRQLCDPTCAGIPIPTNPETAMTPTTDRRWAALTTLTQTLNQQRHQPNQPDGEADL
jgi:uncharacterized protein